MKLEAPIHFIGICGSGMSPIAMLLKANGYEVQGSDISGGNIKNELRKAGILVFDTHHEENISQAKTLVISSAIDSDNVEIKGARKNNLTILHRSDALNYLSEGKWSIFIAGSHGKTSTSALIGFLLKEAGLDPVLITGSSLSNYQRSYLCGQGQYFVAEADESDGSFLKYRPFISVITNIDHDHLDYYKNFESVENAFKEFYLATNKDGTCVCGWDNPSIRSIVKNSRDNMPESSPELIAYGKTIGAHNRLLDVIFEQELTTFNAVIQHDVHSFSIKQKGVHSVLNALAAISVALDVGISVDEIKEILPKFKGVSRRLETIFHDKKTTVINDYAHNPGKIESAIEAVKLAYPSSSLVVVFQPHRYSRLRTMYEKFAVSFQKADHVLVTEIYAAGEAHDEKINHRNLASDISRLSKVSAEPVDDLKQIYKPISRKKSPHNVILILGAGDMHVICSNILEHLGCSNDS